LLRPRNPEPGGGWGNIPSPAPAVVTLALGTAAHIASIQNLRSGETLPSELTVPVSDDPIAVRVTAWRAARSRASRAAARRASRVEAG
jgi:hypothetical protein